MIKRTLIFLTVFLLFLNTKAQDSIKIDTISYSYYNLISNSHQSIELYKITNYSSKEFLTWIADVPINNTPEHRLVHDYFKKQIGDFKYISWMYEEDFGRPVSNWTIGVSFVKMINPQDSFSYFIIKDSDVSNTYKDRIVIMSREKVEHYIGGGRCFVLKENLFFPYSSICLYDKPIKEIEDLYYISTNRNNFDLFLLLSAYHHYHVDYPSTIQDLIIFDSLSNTGQESSRYHNVITFLQKNKEKITWTATDYDIIVLMNNDTLIYYPGGDSHSICYSQYPSEKYIFRFFDHHHHYAYSEETEKMFKYGLKMISMNFSPIEGGGLHIMVYTQKDGLRSFCDNDDSPIDSTWFSSVEKYVDAFSKQHNLGKVIFSIADLSAE